MIYYIVFIFLALMVFNIEVIKIKQFIKIQNIIFFFCSIILIVFAGIRFRTGYDYNTYQGIFNNISTWEIHDLLSYRSLMVSEPGYVLLNYLFKDVGFKNMVFVIAVFSIGLKVLYIYRYCDKKWSSLFVYYGMYMCLYDMGIIRQGISIGLCLWALKCYSEKKYKTYVSLVLFAGMFHATAIIFFIVPIACKIKSNLYGILLVGAFIFSEIWYHCILLLPNSYLVDRILYYINSSESSISSIYFSVIKRCVLFFIFFLIIDWKKAKQELGNLPEIYLNLFFLSIVLSVVMSRIPIMAGRGTAAFQFMQVCIFSYMFNIRYYKKIFSDRRLFLVMFYGFTVIWTMYNLMSLLNSYGYIPYRHI